MVNNSQVNCCIFVFHNFYLYILDVMLFYGHLFFYVFQSAGVQFPQRPHAVQSSHPTAEANKNDSLNGELASTRHEEFAQQAEPQIVPESRYLLLN